MNADIGPVVVAAVGILATRIVDALLPEGSRFRLGRLVDTSHAKDESSGKGEDNG